MDEEKTEKFLEHYGVKGMKWGVRRSPAQLARAAKQRGQQYRQSSKEAKAATARTRFTQGSKDAPTNLTDEELKARIKRMETEKRYNDLNAKTVSVGQQHVSEIVTNVGKQTITTAATGALTGVAALGAVKAVEKLLGKEAASASRKKLKIGAAPDDND